MNKIKILLLLLLFPLLVNSQVVGDKCFGGVVFHVLTSDDFGYDATVKKLWIVDTIGLPDANWGCTDTCVYYCGVGPSVIMGGLRASQLISEKCLSNSNAANLCLNLTRNGYSDWYLPDDFELYELINYYYNSNSIDTVVLWSSTEENSRNAVYRAYTNGIIEAGMTNKENLLSVLAIRTHTLPIWHPCDSAQITYGGEVYNTVAIGTQCWLTRNLNIGTRINSTVQQTNNLVIEKYCYNDIVAYCDTYGGLYQWNEAMKWQTIAGSSGICPTGWHIPTITEFDVLSDYLGGNYISGGKLKETGITYWNSPNTSATNTSGFYARGAGALDFYGISNGLKNYNWIWTSTISGGMTGPSVKLLAYNSGIISTPSSVKTNAFSIRCIKDFNPTCPLVETFPTTNIGDTSAMGNGIIMSDGGLPLIERGICWDTDTLPRVTDSHYGIATNMVGSFYNYPITGLTPGTTYYVRAYGTNSIGTCYGNQDTIITQSIISCPAVTTDSITNISYTTAIANGTVIGSEPYQSKGFCWALGDVIPTTSDYIVTVSGTNPIYYGKLYGLVSDGYTYSVRSFTRESGETCYGEKILFQTKCIFSPTQPVASTHVVSYDSIEWNWLYVPNATGYKFGTTNDYSSAIDVGNTLTYIESGLDSGECYTRYVWAYNACGNTGSTAMYAGTDFLVNHIAGDVAPLTISIRYNTIAVPINGTLKCWLGRNLGAERLPISKFDTGQVVDGWYWQFNRKQGYSHIGITRIPNIQWDTSALTASPWDTINDPCNIELGSKWLIPTITDWFAIDDYYSLVTTSDAFNSPLKFQFNSALDYQSGQYMVFTLTDEFKEPVGDIEGSTTFYYTDGNWYQREATDVYKFFYKSYLYPPYTDSFKYNYEHRPFGVGLRCIKIN